MSIKHLGVKPLASAARTYRQYAAPRNARDRAQIEADLQRLDVDIAAHVTQSLAQIDLTCPVAPYEVFEWRHASHPQYERWRDDLFASRYWDAADAGAAESGPEGRTFPLLDTLTIYLVGIFSTLLVQGICRMFAAWGGH